VAHRLTTVRSVAATMLAALAAVGGLTGSPLGTLLLALVAIGVVVLVGRFVLSVAWKLVVLATLVVAGLWVVSTLAGGLL
jgi:hypothetical protein